MTIKTHLRINKKTNALITVQHRKSKARLTDAERRERKRALAKKRTAQKRKEYTITYVPPCAQCGRELINCTCKPIDAHRPEYRDVVRVLNVKTMKTKVEIR